MKTRFATYWFTGIPLILTFLFQVSLSFGQAIDFETTVPSNWSVNSGSLSISNDHYKLGAESVHWNWVGGDTLTIDNPSIDPTKIVDFNHHTTVLWIYNETPGNDTITFEYLDASDVVNYHFNVILNFEGWRKVTRSYKYDMYRISGGTLNVARMRVVAPETGTGKLFFDDWNMVRTRTSRMRTSHMPDIHGYLSNAYFWNIYNYPEDLTLTTPTTNELTGLQQIRSSVQASFLGGAPGAGAIVNADNFYNSRNIVINGSSIKGKSTTPAEANNIVLTFARDYLHNGNNTSLQKAEELIWLITDGGYAGQAESIIAGSFGYGIRNYHAGVLLLYPHLSSSLQTQVKDWLRWNLEIGEYWETTSPFNGWSSDYVHVTLRYALAYTIFCLDDNEAVRHLKGFKRLLERKNVPSSNTSGWLKPDNTSFHHGTHYYAYMYAFTSYVNVLKHLRTTEFQINQEAYEEFRDAAYAYLIFCNGNHYANSLSGRHPFSTGLSMSGNSYKDLAFIGGEITGQTADSVMAGAYNRLWGNDSILSNDYSAEAFPEGFWQYNYSPVGVYRKDNWVSTIHGINKTFWGTEIYSTANRFGRYQSYGAIEIMYPGGRDSSGMTTQGYDWNHPPGTTTKILPWNDLEPPGSRLDERASSDYAAALRFNGDMGKRQGDFGMYGFDFQQRNYNSTYEPTFKFKKTMFCFDSIIVCLGSNIQSMDVNHSIVTTLFQSSLPNQGSAIIENGTHQTGFPYSTALPSGSHWIMDAWSTGYYIDSQDSIKVSKTNQSSPHQSGNGSFTNGDFGKAWIDHGTTPTNATYEFVVLPNSTASKMAAFNLAMQDPLTRQYDILKQDSLAHIVHHKPSDVYAISLFDTTSNLIETSLQSANHPCLIMYKKNLNRLDLSMVDPSTAFLQNNSTIQLKIDGEYSILESDTTVTVVSSGGGSTTLDFDVADGDAMDVKLCPQINLFDSVYICAGETHTFHDGSSQMILGTTPHQSVLQTVDGCDSLITTTVFTYSLQSSNDSAYVCHGSDYTFHDGSTQTISTTTTHQSALQTINGCDSLITTTVFTYPTFASTDTTSVCQGESFTFPDGNSQIINAPTTYISSLFTANGCDSTITTFVDVDMIDVSVAQNGTSLLANLSGVSYQWLDCTNNFAEISGETNQEFVATTNGEYAVVVSDGSCSDTSSCFVVNTIGLDETTMDWATISPNPSNGEIAIQLPHVETATISITDNHGRLVHYSTETGDKFQVILNEAEGLYFVTVKTENNITQLKLLMIK